MTKVEFSNFHECFLEFLYTFIHVYAHVTVMGVLWFAFFFPNIFLLSKNLDLTSFKTDITLVT